MSRLRSGSKRLFRSKFDDDSFQHSCRQSHRQKTMAATMARWEELENDDRPGAVAARIEAALRAAKMHVFFQDRDLRYTTVASAEGEGVGAELLGRTDEQVLPST